MPKLFAVLEVELDKGAAAHGWPDQTWTLARRKTLIGRRFHKSLTLSGISQMLRRHGWSPPGLCPARGQAERGGYGRTGEGDLALRGSTAAALDAYLVFEDGAGFSMTPPSVPPGPARRIPIIHVRERSRLIYRPIIHPDHKTGGPRSFAWTDYRSSPPDACPAAWPSPGAVPT